MIFVTLFAGDVMRLTEDTFDLYENKLVKFFVPYCGICKALAPVWADIASELTEVDVVEVDCTQQVELCAQHDIHGYPKIRLFFNGKVHAFSGELTYEQLLLWARGMVTPQFIF